MFRRISVVVAAAYSAVLGLMVVFTVVALTILNGIHGLISGVLLALGYVAVWVLFFWFVRIVPRRAHRRNPNGPITGNVVGADNDPSTW